MKTYNFNGEGWYLDDRTLFKRIRQWFIWIGGWELANGKGWRFTYDPNPISIFGHWLTTYGWGLNFKIPSGWFVIVWNKHMGRCIYISKNATPDKAHCWIYGTPDEIKREVESRCT